MIISKREMMLGQWIVEEDYYPEVHTTETTIIKGDLKCDQFIADNYIVIEGSLKASKISCKHGIYVKGSLTINNI